jgi:endonuclease G, mitochondrial
VPTHFAKVILASKPSSPATPDVPEISTGAFVLPNAVISDETPLETFVMPGEFVRLVRLRLTSVLMRMVCTVEAVERAAGLTLFSDLVKKSSRHICQTTKCEVLVRRFDDAQKRPELRKAVSAPPR